MRLIDWINSKNGYVVFPLNCLPGMRTVDGYVAQILQDPGLKFSAALTFTEKFGPDLVFYPNDVTVEAEALGATVQFSKNSMPVVVRHPVKSMADLNRLRLPDPDRDGRMPVNIETVRRLAGCLPGKPKVAHVMGPFTVAGHLSGIEELARKTLTDPPFVQALLELTTETVIRYAKSLIRAGAGVLYVAEPSASLISPHLFRKYLVVHLKRLFESVLVMNFLHVCGDTTYLVDELVATGAQGLSFDNKVNLLRVEDRVPPDVVLIGNIDPVGIIKDGKPGVIQKAVERLLVEMQAVGNFALSSGCAVPAETPFANIAAFIKAGREFPRPLPGASAKLKAIERSLLNAEAERVRTLVRMALAEGVSPAQILHGGLVRGVRKAGLAYEDRQLHIPELFLIVDAMNGGLELIKPLLVGGRSGYHGRVVIGTVRGDIHDIGKNLVATMLEANGFAVFDLGVDVSEKKFLDAYRKYIPDVIGMSSFTTLSAKVMGEIVMAFQKQNLRDKVKFMIGGAAVTPEYAIKIGAEGYAPDAVSAVEKVRELLDSGMPGRD